ncbi:MAG: tRNA (N(6)-L-threonylcarbamoyladenosine(37)-C(2))-methylthiotransferase MtaB [Chloroflexi bacterium]|jgi:threonylcarbamoyladenosine tRNA methylthiotransferase MtaB|nr:tRNA (N(6)-L-threonylcarbamoyladenosine(37)-C(2))-methylthiotransferase MtaB [Anaerolineaceae bacterium]NLI44203.1 tRNA (N(6)-L-threonylcarbamoyladenosine(37)-C(2))-methylthiotransferase MtaB [Chloroflexota bacterium]HOE35676.1 tRNA (N(6)-L-threonylcarbamoyladenosine(37)-C(2))-methylthiotransferase MtaB [Anaerolineaceae bacterium]HQH57513.1 tRNA (N(6)-L-threonylcarbamoyladenosine(37)-C(2))-methylthiotransferase MtaB [Anaerolineaceae bacterium]HQL27048.1 tRNA (N(6)-L-threonylcarbamoyladenosin
MKIYLDMVGCRLNQSEIEKLALDLLARGQEIVTDPAAADYVIVNTCCVTAKACADSRKVIRRYQRETGAQVLATGCYVSAFTRQAAELVGEDLSFPNADKDAIPQRFPRGNAAEPLDFNFLKPALGARSRTRSFIKVQEGCDNYCTYCLTRIARGKSHSVPMEEVIRQAKQAEEAGIKEIVLTGVQIGSWGKDLPENGLRIAALVSALLEETSLPRIRISSIEPWDVDEALLYCFRNPRLCPHLHIPLQSGSESILRRMARPFSAANFRALMQKIHLKRPKIAVTTDILCGFPGETDDLFLESLAFIREMDFAGGHVFKFSPMPGTAAARMDGKVQESISQTRSEIVRGVLRQKLAGKQQSKVGTHVEVLWEHSRNHVFHGFTPDYFRVRTKWSQNLANTITMAVITEISQDGVLIAEIAPAEFA